MMSSFLHPFKITPIVGKKIRDPETHNLTEVWIQLKTRRHGYQFKSFKNICRKNLRLQYKYLKKSLLKKYRFFFLFFLRTSC